MFTFTSFEVLTAEHNLRIDSVNRYGWLRSEALETRRPGRLSAVLSALVTVIGRPNAPRNASTTGQTQGAA